MTTQNDPCWPLGKIYSSCKNRKAIWQGPVSHDSFQVPSDPRLLAEELLNALGAIAFSECTDAPRKITAKEREAIKTIRNSRSILLTLAWLFRLEASKGYWKRELWIRAHSGLGKIPVVLTLLGLSSSLECATKTSNFPLWGEKVVSLASWGGLLISRSGVPTEMLHPNPGVLIHKLAFTGRPQTPTTRLSP